MHTKEVLAKSYQGYKKELELGGRDGLRALHQVLVLMLSENPSKLLDSGRRQDLPTIFSDLFSKSKNRK